MNKKPAGQLEVIIEESKARPEDVSNFTKNKKSKKSAPIINQENEGIKNIFH